MADQHEFDNPLIAVSIDTFNCREQEPYRFGGPEPEPVPLNDPAALNRYSRIFFDMLMGRRPEWRPLAKMIANDESGGAALFLKVSAPSIPFEGLWISTVDEQVTVGLGPLFHMHFAQYEPDSDPLHQAILFIEEVIREEWILAVAMADQRLAWSGIQRPGESTPPYRTVLPLPLTANRVCLLSWNGTFDGDGPCK